MDSRSGPIADANPRTPMKASNALVLALPLAFALATPALGQRGLTGERYESMPIDQENLFPAGTGP